MVSRWLWYWCGVFDGVRSHCSGGGWVYSFYVRFLIIPPEFSLASFVYFDVPILLVAVMATDSSLGHGNIGYLADLAVYCLEVSTVRLSLLVEVSSSGRLRWSLLPRLVFRFHVSPRPSVCGGGNRGFLSSGRDGSSTLLSLVESPAVAFLVRFTLLDKASFPGG